MKKVEDLPMIIAPIFLLMLMCGPVLAVVLHGSAPAADWSGGPPAALLARVGACSGTVIHPSYVLTAKHYSVSTATPVVIGGEPYAITEIHTHPYADMRLLKIDAHLDVCAAIPPERLEQRGAQVVIGGYGRVRGKAVTAWYDPNTVVGYEWGSAERLTFGTSNIYSDNVERIYLKFRDPDTTPYECSLALHDSGCGAFIQKENTWYVVAVGESVSDFNASYFKHMTIAGGTHNSMSILFRTYPMRGWIKTTIYGADMTEDGTIDQADLADFCGRWSAKDHPAWPYVADYYQKYNSRSDLNGDGRVNLLDFARLRDRWRGVCQLDLAAAAELVRLYLMGKDE